MANVKKAFTGEIRDLVDPYIDVQFAGQRVCFLFSSSKVYCNILFRRSEESLLIKLREEFYQAIKI